MTSVGPRTGGGSTIGASWAHNLGVINNHARTQYRGRILVVPANRATVANPAARPEFREQVPELVTASLVAGSPTTRFPNLENDIYYGFRHSRAVLTTRILHIAPVATVGQSALQSRIGAAWNAAC